MGLSCDCDYQGCLDVDWYWWPPKDYQELSTKRSRKCSALGCKRKIAVGDLCIEFERTRQPRTEVELKIYDEEDCQAIGLASYWLCEECADLWFSLEELGFKCVSPDEDIRQFVRDYATMSWK